jgi:hypothetical protein
MKGRRKKRDYIKDPISLSDISVPLKIDFQDLDDWQREIIDYKGNIAICSGRQVGKSAIMALKAALTLLQYDRIKILISSGSERQAAYIYEKVKQVLNQLKDDPYAETPTMRRTVLKNASELYCLPTGKTGDLIRGLTLDVWIPDEAAYINDAVWATISPMLWISKNRGMGWIWALSTPAGKIGRFYDCFNNPEYKTWRISSLNCPRIPKSELEMWKRNYTRVQYEQEVLGNFVDEISRFFPDNVLQKCFIKDLEPFINTSACLGVDVARYGGDQNAFVEAQEKDEKYRVTFCETTERQGIHETFRKIQELDTRKRYKKILVDDGGVGGGLTDFLIEKYKTRVIGINNASRSITFDKKKRKRLMKEDIYSNALIMMEQGNLQIIDNDELRESLQSVLYEYSDTGELKIYARYNHPAEAMVRALWGVKKKHLNLWAASKSNQW